MGVIEDRCKSFDEQKARDKKAKDIAESKKAAEVSKLTKEVIDQILKKAETFNPGSHCWIEINGETKAGWQFYHEREYEGGKFLLSDGRMVKKGFGDIKYSYYSPYSLLEAMYNHVSICQLARGTFKIRCKKKWDVFNNGFRLF